TAQLVELVVAVAAGPDPRADGTGIRGEATHRRGRIDDREARSVVDRRSVHQAPRRPGRQHHRAQVDVERAGQSDRAGSGNGVDDARGTGTEVVDAARAGVQHAVDHQAGGRVDGEVARPGVGRVVELDLADERDIAVQ